MEKAWRNKGWEGYGLDRMYERRINKKKKLKKTERDIQEVSLRMEIQAIKQTHKQKNNHKQKMQAF